MEDTAGLVLDSAERLFAAQTAGQALARAEQEFWLPEAWAAVEAAGFSRALLPEDAGGSGLDPVTALLILRVAGRHALPLPLAETMMAGWLLAGAGLEVPAGPLTVAPVLPADLLTLEPDGNGWRLFGTARRIPWGRQAVACAALADRAGQSFIALVPQFAWETTPALNLAREPRDTLLIDAWLNDAQVAPLASGIDLLRLRAMGAAMRSQQLAGALARVQDMTTQHARERAQFGRPIGTFQAIRQSVAVLAGECAAAQAAADGAAEAVGRGHHLLPIAAAKIRTGEAAGRVAALAHQIHGAIGFTVEHDLHFLTRRLWSWREEFGPEIEWSAWLGRHISATTLWPTLTDNG
jgi:acyl-CoA dehydrogenase